MDSEWLKTQFDLHPDKSKAGLAKALSLDAPAISKILNGKRQIKAKEYMGMRRFFGLPVDGARAALGAGGTSYVLEPLRDNGLRDSAGGEQQESWVMPAHLFEQRTKAAPDKIRIFSVQEQAMVPDFTMGEHVLVDLSDTKPSPPGFFVVSDGVGHIIRQCTIVPQSDPLKVKVSARKEGYETYEVSLGDGGIVGRVIAKLQWL